MLYLGTARVGVDDTRACRRGWVLEPSTSDLMMRSAAVALPLGGGDECKQRRRASRSRPGLSMRRRRIASTTGSAGVIRPRGDASRGAEELKFIRSHASCPKGSCPKGPHSAALPPAQGTRLQHRRAQSTPGGPGTLTAAHGRGASMDRPRTKDMDKAAWVAHGSLYTVMRAWPRAPACGGA